MVIKPKKKCWKGTELRDCRYDVRFAVIVWQPNSFWPIHFLLGTERVTLFCHQQKQRGNGSGSSSIFFFVCMSLLRLNWIKSTIRKSLDSCITEVPFPIPFGAFVAVFSSSIFPWISVYVVSHFFIFSVRRFFCPGVLSLFAIFSPAFFFISCFTLYGPRKWLFPLHVLFFVVITRSLSLFLHRLNLHFFKKALMLFSVFSVVIHPCCRGGKLNVFIFISLY